MHLAQSYIDTIFQKNSSAPLNSQQASFLSDCLAKDARSYAYSGVITLTEAICGIEKNAFSWSTVKLYYATFYFLRSILASRSHCIFYENSKPYVVLSKAGSVAVKAKGNTHGLVFSQFRTHEKSHWLLSQEIDSENALDWLRHLREVANYTLPRFIEPAIPRHFERIVQIGLRKTTNSYIANDYFAFDPDHAVLAYPLRALIFTLSEVNSGPYPFEQSDRAFLSSLCKDKDGPITSFNKLLGLNA